MRRMAGDTSPGLHHGVLIGKRPRRIGKAFGADRVLVICRPQLTILEGAVRIVAVRAAHLPFVDLMVKRLGESGAHILVTREAQKGLLHLQKAGLTRGPVHAVATEAAYPRLRVL